MTNNKILIVDDEAPIRNMLKIALNKIGYKVRVATGAEEALEILEQEQIPLIFIDLGLETMNGFELCERVRKDHPNAIIYALSGRHAGLFDPQDLREAGFDGYDANPIVIENLMSGYDWYGIDAEFAVAEALGAFTIKKPFDRKSILKAIKQIQNLILFGICFLSIS